MKRFIEGEGRTQITLLPECLDDYVDENNSVRVVDVFVDELDLSKLGFAGVEPLETGRPSYHPCVLLKLYIYGYLNRIQSSRRLERETQCNVELMWLTGRLMPDKTIADFRKDNGQAIRGVCREFILLCQKLKLFSDAMVAIDGSKFKAVNNRDKNFTDRKLKARRQQLEESIARYLDELDRADRQPAAVPEVRVAHLKEKMVALKEQVQRLNEIGGRMQQAPDQQISLTDPDARSMATRGRGTGIVGYNVQTAVDTKHHMIVAHEVTNLGHDRTQLASMAKHARSALGTKELTVLADRGYFSGQEVLEMNTSVLPINERSCALPQSNMACGCTNTGPPHARSVQSKRNAPPAAIEGLRAGSMRMYWKECSSGSTKVPRPRGYEGRPLSIPTQHSKIGWEQLIF